MVKHIVIWKLKNEHNRMNKAELAQEMKSQLLALKNQIPQIKDIKVGINSIHFEKNSDLVLESDFNSFEDLATYSTHPEHMKVVEFAKQIVIDRAAVDYEY